MKRSITLPALAAFAAVATVAHAAPSKVQKSMQTEVRSDASQTNRAAARRIASANRAASIEPAASGFVNAVQVFPYTTLFRSPKG